MTFSSNMAVRATNCSNSCQVMYDMFFDFCKICIDGYLEETVTSVFVQEFSVHIFNQTCHYWKHTPKYEYHHVPHLKISKQRMAKNSCCTRMLFLHIPFFLDSLKELLAAVCKKSKSDQAVIEN